ncbi:hypothetical protein AB0H34_02315 [Saccharopolyspora shandongensis]|uniref:hypothetical protein n=1 Tax=Saccharopolyspora shandongensis TaxID=418495 RepID=UPI0033CC9CB3
MLRPAHSHPAGETGRNPLPGDAPHVALRIHQQREAQSAEGDESAEHQERERVTRLRGATWLARPVNTRTVVQDVADALIGMGR